MHILCFDCALAVVQEGRRPTTPLPAISARVCPVCGSENPFDMSDVEFRPTVPGLYGAPDTPR